jgi:branched-chain amino acid aminotransferase
VSITQTTKIRRTGSPQQPDRSLDPSQIDFGRWVTPNFFHVEYAGGKWGEPLVSPVENFSLHPAALVFHYAQAIFEGLKAYRWADGSLALFRVESNARRFNASAARMDMPHVPEDLFIDAVHNLVDLERNFVPAEPGSLYIRPTMIATEPCIGVRGANNFIFFVLTLPAGGYFKETSGGIGAVKVQVAETAARAAIGGTGAVKAAANYAVTLKTINEAKDHGCAQVLYLDARGNRQVEEMGGMNVFFLREGKLVTPPLNGTILPGITRDSILQLAPVLGVEVLEEPITIDEVESQVHAGKITEAFACGTAAVVTGISALRFEDGRTLNIGGGQPGPLSQALYSRIIGMQFGREADPFGWVSKVNPA